MPPTKNNFDKQVLQYDAAPLLNISDLKAGNVLRNTPTQYDTKLEAKWAKEMSKATDFKKVKLPLIFSAANTFEKDKGHLDVVACRNIFPTNPTIEFHNDRSDHFGGEISIWLEGLVGGEQLQFIIRMGGYNSGGAEVKIGASYPTSYSLTPIQISGSMNLTLGNVLQVPSQPTGGLGLITLRVQFSDSQWANWLFYDVRIRNLNVE